jgi:hypothetical protein
VALISIRRFFSAETSSPASLAVPPSPDLIACSVSASSRQLQTARINELLITEKSSRQRVRECVGAHDSTIPQNPASLHCSRGRGCHLFSGGKPDLRPSTWPRMASFKHRQCQRGSGNWPGTRSCGRVDRPELLVHAEWLPLHAFATNTALMAMGLFSLDTRSPDMISDRKGRNHARGPTSTVEKPCRRWSGHDEADTTIVLSEMAGLHGRWVQPR